MHKLAPIPDDYAADQNQLVTSGLSALGFEQYEISNFAKEGFVSQHNSNYWKGEKYLGIGPSAHSFVGNKRLWNVSNNPKYINAIENNTLFFEEEIIDENTAYNEYILTRLRTIWGIDIMDLNNKFNSTLIHHFKKEISPFLQNNFVQQRKNVFILTKKGIFIADKISSDLFFIP
ncbi:MAG TPA: hypothetical protein PK649_04605 [Vicingus sp.]|nr:hypothetical protein [Vicingus sp.]